MILHEDRLFGLEINTVHAVYQIADIAKKRLNRDTIIIFGYRSNYDQHQLFLIGRNGDTRPIVTKADATFSPHNYSCAIDFWVMSADGKTIDWNNKDFPEIINEVVSKTDKVISGMSFTSIKDTDHIEYKNWRNVRSGGEKIIPHTKEEPIHFNISTDKAHIVATQQKDISDLGIKT